MQVLTNLLRTYDVAPPNRPGQRIRRGGGGAALARLRSGQRARPRRRTPRPTIPSGSSRSIAICTRATRPVRGRQARRGDRDAAAASSRGVPTPPTPTSRWRTRYWEGGRPAARRSPRSRTALASGAPDRDIRIRLGLYLAESGTDAARAIALLEGMPADDVEALNGLGVAYGDAGRVRRGDRGRSSACWRWIRPTGSRIRTWRRWRCARRSRRQPASRGAAASRGGDAYARRRSTSIRRCPTPTRRSASCSRPPAARRKRSRAGSTPSRSTRRSSTRSTTCGSSSPQAGRRDEAVAYGRQFVATAPPAFFQPDIARVAQSLKHP